MGSIFRTNNPLQYDEVDGIVVDERAPEPNVNGEGTGVAIIAGQFQRGKTSLTQLSGLAGFLEEFGESSYSGNLAMKNKRFSSLKVLRVLAADSVLATLTHDAKLQFDALSKGLYGNKLLVKIENASDDIVVPAVKASFDAAISGLTGNAELEAAIAGIAGNAILITGDGVKTLTVLVSDWNIANAGNQVVLISANGAEVPDNAEAMQLAGGVAETQSPDAGVKITLSDSNDKSVLNDEVYDNVKIAEITASTFANSKIAKVTVLSTASEPIVLASTPLAAGSDGVVIDTDYETAIQKAEAENSGNVIFLDVYNSVRNTYLKAHAAITSDKMVILAGGEDDSISTIQAAVTTLRDTAGRIIYADNWVETLINGVLTYTSPASWVASMFSQVGPHVSLGYAGNAGLLYGVTGLKNDYTRQNYIDLNNAGVAAFEFDSDIGFGIKSAIVTQIANSSKITILRRRMADFLTNSHGKFLKIYKDDVNKRSKRIAVKSAMLRFIEQQEAIEVLPKDSEVDNGKAKIVDIDSLNTNDTIAAGKFFIKYKQRIFSSMRYIVLIAEIGESVVVTEEDE